MDLTGASQYTRAFHSEPKLITSHLRHNRITSVQIDGEMLDTLLNDEQPMIRKWIGDYIEKKGSQQWEGDDILLESAETYFEGSLADTILERLSGLASRAVNGRTISNFSSAELYNMPFLRQKELALVETDSSVNKLLKKWRHINPKVGKDIITKEAMIDLEKKLKDKWLERLLTHFLHSHLDIPKLRKFDKNENMVNECKSLFGKRRWRTIKKYTIELEAILRIQPDFIPRDEPKVRKWLSKLEETKDVTPNKLATLWNTIRPLSNIFDFIDPHGINDLKSKMERVMDELSEGKTKKDNRAVVPGLDLVKEIERLARTHRLTTIRYYMACARFAMATSARGNDLQHTSPSTWRISKSLRELHAWQTKTTTVHEANKRPIPLISPLHSFTEHEWWLTMDTTFELFAEDEKFKDLDFIFPALTRDRIGFIPRPASNAQIMAIIRDELYKSVPHSTMWETTDGTGLSTLHSAHLAIKTVTMASWRVLIPEWASKADLPRELRRWLGRWREDSMADNYTRDHRGKIIEIMSLLQGKENLMGTSSEVPEDISDDHFVRPKHIPLGDDLGQQSGLLGVPEHCQSPLDGSPPKSARIDTNTTTDGYEMVEAPAFEEIMDAEIYEDNWFSTRSSLINSLKGSRFPASQLPEHLDGPMSLVRTKKGTGSQQVKKVHLALTTRTTAGCGINASKLDIITELETIPLQATTTGHIKDFDPRLCARCFKFYYWDKQRDPSLLSDSWCNDIQDIKSDSSSDSMPSASGDSEDTNDSASEEEALRPPKNPVL